MNDDTVRRAQENDAYPAATFDFHAFSIGLSKHLCSSLTLSAFSVPEMLFRVELYVFPQKLQDMLDRLTLLLPVPNPTSPRGRALGALSTIKELVEQARAHAESGDFEQAKEKISEADSLASDASIFPTGMPGPGLPPNPVSDEDVGAVRVEIRFMKRFVAAILGIESD